MLNRSSLFSEQLRSPQLLRSDADGMVKLGSLSGVSEVRVERVGTANLSQVYKYAVQQAIRVGLNSFYPCHKFWDVSKALMNSPILY
jgi:hypothetical protein